MKIINIIAAAGVLAIAACEPVSVKKPAETASSKTEVQAETKPTVEEAAANPLQAVLAAQPGKVKARYKYRKPAQTLNFFGVKPGMTVVEALPGGGWYSKILIPYLGSEGTLVGAHYPAEMWAKFGFGEEWVASRVERTNNWLSTAADWGVEGANIESQIITNMTGLEDRSVDTVLFIRALHNLNRFNSDGGFADAAIAESFRVLKKGGIVGVVQHRAPEDAPDETAQGQRGYIKQSDVIAKFEAAGFKFVNAREFNANAKDQPGVEDVVWRLPPSLNGTEEGTPEREAMLSIGESDRMTLKFRKPGKAQ